MWDPICFCCCCCCMFRTPLFSTFQKNWQKGRVEDKRGSFIMPDFIKGRHLTFILAFSHSNFVQFCLVFFLLWKNMTRKFDIILAVVSILANVKKKIQPVGSSTKLPSHYSLRDLTVSLLWSSLPSFSKHLTSLLHNPGLKRLSFRLEAATNVKSV